MAMIGMKGVAEMPAVMEQPVERPRYNDDFRRFLMAVLERIETMPVEGRVVTTVEKYARENTGDFLRIMRAAMPRDFTGTMVKLQQKVLGADGREEIRTLFGMEPEGGRLEEPKGARKKMLEGGKAE